MENIIELENVNFSYFRGQKTIENVSLKIKKNDFLAIIGPNGGGKSTLLKLMLGLLKPSSGKIRIAGKKPEKGRHYAGYVPQHFNFDFQFPMTVLDVVLMGRLFATRPGKKYTNEDINIAKRSLKQVEMSGFEDRQISMLSGGQRQRVLIARALAVQPRVLLLDEPVSSIDSNWQASFYQILKKLNKSMAIVIVTHNMGFVSTYIKKIACMNITLHYHGSTKEGIEHLSGDYQCPVEMVAHGVPHRVLGEHNH